jgi:hypothetical protein
LPAFGEGRIDREGFGDPEVVDPGAACSTVGSAKAAAAVPSIRAVATRVALAAARAMFILGKPFGLVFAGVCKESSQ